MLANESFLLVEGNYDIVSNHQKKSFSASGPASHQTGWARSV